MKKKRERRGQEGRRGGEETRGEGRGGEKELIVRSGEKQMLQELKMVLVVIPPAHVDMLKVLLPSLKRFSENSKVSTSSPSHLSSFLSSLFLAFFGY